jgi:RNA polymerase sigma factor (sigma-70 family)
MEKARSEFRRGAGPSEVYGLPDEELLARFLDEDEAEAKISFEVLVRRHGPMVLGVCRHILGQVSDAEDAFQATFLVLARKASSIRDRRVLGRWLYEVAYRIAVRSKANAVRRRYHERQGAEMSAVAPGLALDHGWSELKPVLHEEVNRLPEKYRTAVVLCYLEGHTNEEAAEMLNWPVGTVKGRLSRARDMLRKRLTRRGLTLSASFLLFCMSKNAVLADVVPSHLSSAAVRTALLATRGDAANAALIPRRIARLADEASTSSSPWFTSAQGLATAALALFVVAVVSFGIQSGLSQINVPVSGGSNGYFATPAKASGAPLGSSLTPIPLPQVSSAACH